MKGKLIIVGAILVILVIIIGAIVAMQTGGGWTRTYGGKGGEWGWSVVQTSDGGYALAGYSIQIGAGDSSYDFLLVKTDSAGTMEWNKTYGGTTGDLAHSVVQTSDGGYAMAGITNEVGSVPGGPDFWLVKTDKFGMIPESPLFLLLEFARMIAAIVTAVILAVIIIAFIMTRKGPSTRVGT